MAESDGAWGALAQRDDELAKLWDSFAPLPEAGDNPALDAFVDRKRISIASLVRIGTRMADSTVLAFAFPGGVKYRDLVTDRRWAYVGSDWRALKLVPAKEKNDGAICIVAEGESDGARLSDVYPTCDIAILPAGADPRPHAAEYAEQLAHYELVLLGQDDDRAGDEGARILAELLPQAVRFKPTGNDWCSTEDFPPLPNPDDIEPSIEEQILVTAGDLVALEPPPIISWYEHGLLPVAGQLILHGGWKGFKSFISIDMLAALAQGQDWCCFEPTEEPCRVAIMQYEIPWAYYQQRVKLLRSHAREPELFDSNFLTFTPLRRPQFKAGNKAQEDFVLKTLETADVQVFLLDPIRRATGVADLNSEKDVRPLLEFFERLQDAGITVITTHHDNKSFVRSGGGDSSGMTGSGAFAGDADSIVSVSLPRGGSIEEPRRNLHFTLRNAPHVAPRGMEMGSDGKIVYSPEPYGDGLEGDESGPSI